MSKREMTPAQNQTALQTAKRTKSWKDPTPPANPPARGQNKMGKALRVTTKRIGLTDHIPNRYK